MPCSIAALDCLEYPWLLMRVSPTAADLGLYSREEVYTYSREEVHTYSRQEVNTYSRQGV